MTITIGKTKIDIKVRGCMKCGTEYSSGWTLGKIVTVMIGTKKKMIDIPLCIECKSQLEKTK